jgi:hypothetical protein
VVTTASNEVIALLGESSLRLIVTAGAVHVVAPKVFVAASSRVINLTAFGISDDRIGE